MCRATSHGATFIPYDETTNWAVGEAIPEELYHHWAVDGRSLDPNLLCNDLATLSLEELLEKSRLRRVIERSPAHWTAVIVSIIAGLISLAAFIVALLAFMRAA